MSASFLDQCLSLSYLLWQEETHESNQRGASFKGNLSFPGLGGVLHGCLTPYGVLEDVHGKWITSYFDVNILKSMPSLLL